MSQYDDLPAGAEVVGYSDLPSGAEVVSATPAAKPQNLDMTGLPPLKSQWDATKFSLGQALGGAYDVGKGLVQSLAPPQNNTERFLNLLGPMALPAKRMLQSTGDTLSQATQVPEAIKDLINAPQGLAALAAVAPRAGGQGAAMLGLSEIPKAINAIPSAGRASLNFAKADAAAGSTAIDAQSPAITAIKIKELAQSGGTMPKVVRDFIRRIQNAEQGPLTYSQARKFYVNATRVSADEFNRLTPTMQRELGGFTRDLGVSIQEAANKSGVGPQHAAAMEEFRQVSKVRGAAKTGGKMLRRYVAPGAAGAAGAYVMNKLAGGR